MWSLSFFLVFKPFSFKHFFCCLTLPDQNICSWYLVCATICVNSGSMLLCLSLRVVSFLQVDNIVSSFRSPSEVWMTKPTILSSIYGGYLSQCSVTVKRQHDHCNSHKRKYLTGTCLQFQKFSPLSIVAGTWSWRSS